MRVVRKCLAITKKLACSSFSHSVAFSIPENTLLSRVDQRNRNTKRKRGISTFWRGYRCVAAAILSRISFLSRVPSFLRRTDRPVFPIIPSKKNGGGEREEGAVSRAQERKKRGRHERTTDETPRCLPFIKLLLNAAFLRTHNWIGKTAKIMPLPARIRPQES